MSTKVAIIGSGNIGTDLLIKIKRLAGDELETVALVGIDPESDGLARAQRLGIDAVSTGVQGLLEHPRFDEIEIVFDATSAKAHEHNDSILRPYGKRLIDLTPAAVGPYVVPPVNLDAHLDAPNVNMVTCGGQATIPMVAAISQVTPVHWAEIVASIASKSAGPGTRANIDEFTETTSKAIEQVGGAAHGKAIIILNPAEPPLIMRDTVLALVGEDRKDEIVASIEAMVARSPPMCRDTGSSRRCSSPRSRNRWRPSPMRRGRCGRCRCSSRSRAPRTTCRLTREIWTS